MRKVSLISMSKKEHYVGKKKTLEKGYKFLITDIDSCFSLVFINV